MRKIDCMEVDCQGMPGCSCRTPNYWRSWKIDQIHSKEELLKALRKAYRELPEDASCYIEVRKLINRRYRGH